MVRIMVSTLSSGASRVLFKTLCFLFSHSEMPPLNSLMITRKLVTYEDLAILLGAFCYRNQSNAPRHLIVVLLCVLIKKVSENFINTLLVLLIPLLYIEPTMSFVIGRKHTVNF